jgi:hypothetical protein
VTTIGGPLDLVALWALYALDRPDLKDDLAAADTGGALGRRGATDLFHVIQASDILVHHPYDSFTTSVERFVEQAASDSAVLAIKQTIYRTAGPESAIVRSLIKAAEQGIQVVALVELTARFDEQANIERARVLEEAGVHVVYGLVGLKTTRRYCSSFVRRPTASGGTATSEPATTTPRPRTPTKTSDCSRLIPTSAPTSPTSSTTSPATAIRSSTGSCWSRLRTYAKRWRNASNARRRRAPTVASP